MSRSGVASGFVGWGSADAAFVAKDRRGALVSGAAAASSPAAAAVAAAAVPAVDRAHLLGPWRSTSIAGNDLLSSCLYTAGICASFAGKMAPLSLLVVSCMLYFFRFVYAEVVTALPINGGSYTALSNTTSKRVASLAACLSLISYVATAVVSAEAAVYYVALLVPDAHIVDADTGACPPLCQVSTVGVLGLFAALNLLGLAESANVAVVMFSVHIFALTLLAVWSLIWAVRNNFTLFGENIKTDYPGGAAWPAALYFGYASALLGITGFETAANYVEEMRDSQTYVTTLRNMWGLVAFFNPVLGALAMAVLPMSDIYTYTSNLLGPMAKVVGGPYLEVFICVDGAIVLCGSVLTAYVGVGGLVRRMALDRCLPAALLSRNTWRGTYHWVVLGFFGVASSLVFALNGDVQMLGAVYNVAFLSVMTCFALACVVLKWKRPHLPRMVVASGPTVACAIVFVVAGLVGNIVREPQVLAWFVLYFGVAASVVFTMFNRTAILRTLLNVARSTLATGREAKRARRAQATLIASHAARETELLDEDRPREGYVCALELERADETTTEGGGSADVGVAGAASRPSGSSWALTGVGGALSLFSPHGSSLQWSADAEADLVQADDDEDDEEDAADSDAYGAGSGAGAGEGGDDLGSSLLPSSSFLSSSSSSSPPTLRARLLRGIAAQLEAINGEPCVYFSKWPDFEGLNKAILYVRANEQTSRLVIAHVVDDSAAVHGLRARWRQLLEQRSEAGAAAGPASTIAEACALLAAELPPLPAAAQLMREQVRILDAIYPKLRVDFLAVRGTSFGPAACRFLSGHLGVGLNMMFVSSPDPNFAHRFGALGGVRIVTRASGRAVRDVGEARARAVLKEAGKVA